MGLDITAYGKIEKIDAVFNKHGEPIDPITREPIENSFHLFEHPSFLDRFGDLEDGATYRARKHFAFRAGSYGSYNLWREELAKLAGWPPTLYTDFSGARVSSCAAGAWEADSGPFYELIHFSDCEGTLGTDVCAKLAKDFAEHQDKADVHEDPMFRERYSKWRRAFEVAADSGAVEFH